MFLARLHELIIRLHNPVIAIAAVAAVCAALALVRFGLKEDYRLEAFVATNDESYERFRAFMEEFTSNEFALVAIHGPEEFGPAAETILLELAGQLRVIPAVQRCNSVMDIPGWLRAALGDRLLEHPMLSGNLISEDRRTVAILCQMSGESAGGAVRRQTVARMKEIVAAGRAAHPGFDIILTGPYVTLIDMYAYVDRDLLVFSLAAFALTVVSLWAVFRRLRPMIFAAAVAGGAILCTLGLTVALGVVTSLITQMIVILVIVLSVANCVHLAVAADETFQDLPGAGCEDRDPADQHRDAAPDEDPIAPAPAAAGSGRCGVSARGPRRGL